MFGGSTGAGDIVTSVGVISGGALASGIGSGPVHRIRVAVAVSRAPNQCVRATIA